jgi:hypothetical protein
MVIPAAAQAIQVTVEDGVIAGRVFNGATNEGISGMMVKLTPPKGKALAQHVTRTDSEGAFNFGKLPKGRYLLEVYQGTTPLYRRVIDSTQNAQFEVRLRPK